MLLVLGLATLASLAVAGCGRTQAFPHPTRCVFDADCDAGLRCVDQVCELLPDAGPLLKRFGEPCDAGAECDSAHCLGGPQGRFCSRLCDVGDAGCPASYRCKGLVDRDSPDGGWRVALCAVDQPFLCQACAGDLDCGASGADLCLGLDAGRACGRDCTLEGCPASHDCQAVGEAWQCVPVAGTCACTPETVGLAKDCRGPRNAFGACQGNQVCQADGGFTPCSAPTALPETCNGVDDDCNGLVDDFTPPPCTKVVGALRCSGPQICLASAGLVCAVRPPQAEVCNGQDDDCNGRVDEPFVDQAGRYVTAANCGSCGNDCATAIAHALTAVCDTAPAMPRCRATRCEPGFFPYLDGGLCLELPDTLCRTCATDRDCVGPGSRCLRLDGDGVCGRDCSAGSAYPSGCPSGYACTPQDGGAAQCTPVTGTCSCRRTTLSATRSCTLDVCRGFQNCADSVAGPTWGACDVATYNPEICDGRDNNCDGRIDEGFRNPFTGLYDTAGNCGFCNNDCTKYFSPTLQHTTGVCDTGPATPRCGMGPCLTEVVGGTTFEWVDVDGLPDDGCECRRVQGNLTVDLPDRAPSASGGASWVDQNCDGVDGVQGDAVFVSATAAAGGNGSRTAPLQTITQGLAQLQSSGRKYVLVAQGLYRENVRLFEGAQLFGGYASDFLKRDPLVHTTQLVGVQPTGLAVAAIHAEGLGQGAVETVVAGFTILGWEVSTAAAPGAVGDSSVAVYLRDEGPRLVLQSNDIFAGRGGAGGRGATGAPGAGRQTSAGLGGVAGQNSTVFRDGADCTPGDARDGGAAGTNLACPAASGSAGGGVVCPVYDYDGGTHQGAQQAFMAPQPGSLAGRGGWDWTYDDSTFGCGHVTESGYPDHIQQHDGDDGRPGPDGRSGTGGPGAALRARFGSLSGGRWVAAPAGGLPGLSGTFALGGGGGGAGGGVARHVAGSCPSWQLGATGGGGAAGGCGGGGGQPGGQGGASIALLLVRTAPGTALPTLLGNRLQRGQGGNGGQGGFGGAGGQGGAGGFGGLPAIWSSSAGGKGGEGGNGGPGGGGGGGAGGPSFGVMAFNVDPGTLAATTTFLTSDALSTGGPGGAGGSAPGAASSSGGAGAGGASANLLSLTACGSGCAPGSSCDGNGVCVPD